MTMKVVSLSRFLKNSLFAISALILIQQTAIAEEIEEAPPAQQEQPKAAEAKPEKAQKKEKSPEMYGKSSGVLKNFVFGPSVSLLGFPSLFKFGAEAKYNNVFGFGATYGFIPQISVKDAKVELNSTTFTGRIFPMRGAFFAGVSFGSQTLSGSKTQKITYSGQSKNVTADIDVKTKFLTPHLGWRWVWNSGFFLGLELGVQLASSASTAFDTDAPTLAKATDEYKKLEKDVKDVGDKFGNTSLPYFSFLTLGWYF